MQIISIVAGIIATAFQGTGSTYTSIYLDVHGVGPYNFGDTVETPYTVDTAINKTYTITFNKKRVWGDTDNAAPWTSMLATLTSTTTDVVSSTFNGTLSAGKYLYFNWTMSGTDATHMITRVDPAPPGGDGDPETGQSGGTSSVLRRDGYIRSATFVSFSQS